MSQGTSAWIAMGPGGLPSFMQQPPGSTTPPKPSDNADTSGTSLTTFGPGQPAANLATDTSFSNLQAIPNIDSLTKLVNDINAKAQAALNAARLGPAGTDIQNNLITDVGNWAQGKISPSTINTIAAAMAERGAGGGFGVDSANANAAYMRALGLTSEELQKKALEGYSSLLADNPAAPLYGAQNNLVTPGLYANTADEQEKLKLEYEKLAAAIAAANKNTRGPTTTPTTTTTVTPPPSFIPPAYTPPPNYITPPNTTTTSPYDWSQTPGGSSAAASGGDDVYNYWAQWYDPFGFGDWSQGYGGQVPPKTYYDPSTDTSNYDYGIPNYFNID